VHASSSHSPTPLWMPLPSLLHILAYNVRFVIQYQRFTKVSKRVTSHRVWFALAFFCWGFCQGTLRQGAVGCLLLHLGLTLRLPFAPLLWVLLRVIPSNSLAWFSPPLCAHHSSVPEQAKSTNIIAPNTLQPNHPRLNAPPQQWVQMYK